RVGFGRGGLGCVVHDGTHQSLGKHSESLPAEVRVRTRCGKSRSFVRPTISRLRRVISPNPPEGTVRCRRTIMPIARDYSRTPQSFLFARLTRTKQDFICRTLGSANKWERIP